MVDASSKFTELCRLCQRYCQEDEQIDTRVFDRQLCWEFRARSNTYK